MFSSKEITIFKIGGVQITLDISWFWIFVLAIISFYLSASNLTLDWQSRFLVALSVTLLFFTSVLLHELAHTFIANRYGQNINKITLFIFGGVSNLVREPDKPKTEFLMAIAGPLSSILLGFLFFYLSFLTRPYPAINWLFFNLSYLNFLLGIFNIMPAYPLDGGRIFRAILWQHTKNLQTATQIAALVGKIFSIFIIILGAAQVLFFSTFSGLWLIFVGWFIYRMAAISPFQSQIIRLMQNIKIEDIKRDYPVYKIGDDNFREIIKKMYDGLYDYVLISDQKRVIGILALPNPNEKELNKENIISVNKVPQINGSLSLAEAFSLMAETRSPVLVITKGKDFSGIITQNEIIRQIQSQSR